MNIVPRPTILPPRLPWANKLITSEDEGFFLEEEHQDLDGLQAFKDEASWILSRNASLPPLNLMDSITSLTSTMSLRES
jgi:hypothetical protein